MKNLSGKNLVGKRTSGKKPAGKRPVTSLSTLVDLEFMLVFLLRQLTLTINIKFSAGFLVNT